MTVITTIQGVRHNPGGDLGSSSWAADTRAYLRTPGNNRNLVMWSWCGQLALYSDSEVQQYLDDMNQLEQDFPNVRFVYMTVHTSSGEDPAQNDRVRDFARTHNKLLFDFADMEKFRPDGTPVPMNLVSDGCPWCQTWCDGHASDCANLSQIGDCAHTHPLLCKIKSQAFWWMVARLAGWNGLP
ncbi:MAG: hypothetical protein PHQ40_03490 [Anaerolineaceae bacterium]|nr:hypothetical protein [Anaerolineaceae bacterium]